MQKYSRISFIFFAGLSIYMAACTVEAPRIPSSPLSLWYLKPAEAWDKDALPVGNGRLGGMVFGGIETERILLNEESIWAGPPVPENRVGAFEDLAEARQLFFEGRFAEGEKIIEEKVMAPRISPRSYQPLGDLHLRFDLQGETSDYRRELSLDTALAVTTFNLDGISYRREVFASAVDQVIVVHLSADKPGSISLGVSLDRPADHDIEVLGLDGMRMFGQASHNGEHKGVRFESRLKAILKNGNVTAGDRALVINQADSVTLILAAATDYNRTDPLSPLAEDLGRACQSLIDALDGKSYRELRRRHITDYQELFQRVELTLGDSSPSQLPTDQRLAAVNEGHDDPGLAALYFQYGRYLLISSSRPGDLPANLQGIWNPHIEAPWNSDYHININLQMNYWPAEVGNLSECHLPFFDFIENLSPSGRKTAREVYDCGGITAVHTTDLWHYTGPFGRAVYGMWPMGIGWCTQHFMEHYRFTGDKDFLKQRAFPIIKEAAEFFLDWLVEDPETGRLVSGPTTSPENRFIAPDGSRASLSMGPSMDQEIIWDVFTNCLEAAEILGAEDGITSRINDAIERLALPGIDERGRIMEWNRPFEEVEPGHRHISHLFGVHPGRQFTNTSAPEMIAAAKKTIEYRMSHGGGHTGWSRAWIINFWARFLEAEKAHENLVLLFQKSTNDNLFDMHPPFQIDGNFGGTAGIAEMLLQSHDGVIHLLPALPSAWASGRVKGLCARGGFEIDMIWIEGNLKDAQVLSKIGGPCRIQYREKTIMMDTRSGKSCSLSDLLDLDK
ncbi:glycoside hydrolase N-terminal domain-containing protein [Acidobacteriota bacterium]